MEWCQGSIADAVSESKSRNSIFVVYIEGSDDMSKSMSSAINSDIISAHLTSTKFVAIKLTKDSESHKQFTEIYKIVPVPSLFFIGANGVPLEIVAGDKSEEVAIKKIASAISKISGETINVREKTPARESSSTSGETTNVREKTPSRESSSTSVSDVEPSALVAESSSSETVLPVATPPPKGQSSSSIEERVGNEEEEAKRKALEEEKFKKLISKKKEENLKLEEEREKEMELSRRRVGKEIGLAKKAQQDRELEEMRKEREKEKKLEAEARQRVLRQIEEDRANRAAKMAASQSPPPMDEQPNPPPRPSSLSGDEARIQFKLPNGQTRMEIFPATVTLRDLRSFIDKNITVPFKEYMLATMFPRREFTSRELDKDLRDLELLPSSVILIMPVRGSSAVLPQGRGWTAAFSAMVWALFQPLFNIGSYLRGLITGQRDPPPPTTDTPTTSQPQQDQQARPPYYALGGNRSVRKRGNVHSLSDGNDSNDENNTWNGNSTQLM